MRALKICGLLLALFTIRPPLASADTCNLVTQTGSQTVTMRSLSMSYFPKKYDAKISEAALRRAMFDVHGGIDFYTEKEILFHEMRIDHIWPRNPENPEDPPGPDNIRNYVPTTLPENATKSNRMNRQVTRDRIERNINNYAEKVYEKYLFYKKGMLGKKIPNNKMEEILNLLSRSSLNEKTQKWVMDTVMKDYSGALKDVGNRVKQMILVLEQIRGRELQALKKGDIFIIMRALQELANLENKFRVNPQNKSNAEFVFKYFQMGEQFINILKISKREYKKFNNFGHVKSFFESMLLALNKSHRRTMRIATYIWRRYQGSSSAFIKAIEVRDIYAKIFAPARSTSTRGITLNDYKRSIEKLALVFSPDEIKSLIQKIRDLKRVNRLSSFEASANIFIRIKKENPGFSFVKIVNEAKRQ